MLEFDVAVSLPIEVVLVVGSRLDLAGVLGRWRPVEDIQRACAGEAVQHCLPQLLHIVEVACRSDLGVAPGGDIGWLSSRGSRSLWRWLAGLSFLARFGGGAVSLDGTRLPGANIG